jgi:hypothetical protein
MGITISTLYYFGGYMVSLLIVGIMVLLLQNIAISIVPLFCWVVAGWVIYFGIIPNPPMFYPNQIELFEVVITEGNIHIGLLIVTSLLPMFMVWYYYVRGCF